MQAATSEVNSSIRRGAEGGVRGEEGEGGSIRRVEERGVVVAGGCEEWRDSSEPGYVAYGD